MIAKEYFLAADNRPKQARSQRYVDKIVECAVELINRDGVDALTMTSLAKASGLSVGGIYRYFSTKFELLQFLKDYHLSQFEFEAKKAFERPTNDIAEVVSCLFEHHVSRMEGQENFWRFIINPPDNAADLIARGVRAVGVIEQIFCLAVLRHRKDIGHKNPELAARNAFNFAFSIITLRLRFKGEPLASHDWRNLRLEGAKAITAYLNGADLPLSKAR